MNLKSSVHSIGEVTTQIFHFVGGEKRTFEGLITDSIKEGEMTKIKTDDGRMLIINKKNLLLTEVFKKEV